MDLSLVFVAVAAMSLSGAGALWMRHRRELFERYSEFAVHSERLKRDVDVRQLKVKQLEARINDHIADVDAAEASVRDLDVRITQLSERLSEKWQLGRKLKGVVKLRKQNLVGLEAELARWQERLAALRTANKDWALQQDELEGQLRTTKAQVFEQEDLVENLFELIEKAGPILGDRVAAAAESSDASEVDALKAHMQLLEGQLHYWQSKVSDLGFAVQDIASNDAADVPAGSGAG